MSEPNKVHVERMARLGQYVRDFAIKGGWNPDDGEGAFEFIQRHSYIVGYEDAGGKVSFGGTQTNGSRWPVSALVEAEKQALNVPRVRGHDDGETHD